MALQVENHGTADRDREHSAAKLNKISLFGRNAIAVSIAFLAFAGLLMGQVNIGSLRGTVTDSSGSVITDVEVVLTENQSHAQYKGITDSSGVYVLLALPIGNYKMTVGHPGFETFTETLPLNAGDNKAVDVVLQVGQASEKVEVTGAAPLLETQTGEYSQTESSDTLKDLPLQISGGKRTAAQYMTTLPGYQSSAGFTSQINGSVAGYSEAFVDGVPYAVYTGLGALSYAPFSNEATTEFKVVQTPMADLGNSGGAVFSYIIKSGTDQLHGSAFNYIRNTAFDARCYFCSSISADHQDEWGFSVGGPVIIPKLYDGRNKTFFWFNYGRFIYNVQSGGTTYGVPTDAWKGGDFASALGAQIGTDDLGRPVFAGEIYDPATTRTLSDGTIIRDPFAGNVIPGEMVSSVSSKFQSFYPEPNKAGDFLNYLAPSATASSPEWHFQIKIDQTLGEKDHVSGTYWASDNPNTRAIQLPQFFYPGSPRYTNNGKFSKLNWSHTFSPNLVHTLGFGSDRFYSPYASSPDATVGASTIGLINDLGTCTPDVTIPSIAGTQDANGNLCHQLEGTLTYELFDTWAFRRGKHMIKFGGDFYRYATNYVDNWGESDGFLPAQTGLPGQPSCPQCLSQTGVGYASFLLGDVASSVNQGTVYSSARSINYGVYVQDSFSMTPRLTLGFGLRYDVSPFPRDRFDFMSQFDPTLPNPGAGGLPGALTFLGYGPGRLNTRDLVPTQYLSRNFAPKLSIAYRVADNTVLRAAYTLSYGPGADQVAQGFQTQLQQGFSPIFTSASLDGLSPAFNWDPGFPLPSGPLYGNISPTVANGSGTGFFGKDSTDSATIQNVHADIEHEFRGGIVVLAGYNGSFAHGIQAGGLEPINQLDYAKYGSLGDLLNQSISSPAAVAANIPVPYVGFVGSVAQALRPFPQYQDIENEAAPRGLSTYNALQITARKEFGTSLTFLVGYTLSKGFTNLSSVPGSFSSAPQNAYNLGAETAISPVNIPQQVIFNYTYQLPIGRGKKLMGSSNRAVDAVIGGWSVAGVHTYQSGFPLSVTTEQTLPTMATSAGTLRPDIVSGVSPRTGNGCAGFNPFADVYLNRAAFTDPTPFKFGDAPPRLSSVRGCAFLNENVSLFKTFALSERVNLKLGVDVFNLFNRNQFAAPNGDIDSPAFGRITSSANSPRTMQINGRISW